MECPYEVPSWAGKPSVGVHLDVLKDEKLVQKLMIDDKKYYLFGRNAKANDFCIDHASCSRVHAALVHHKHLNRAFLVDLDSTHGTFIGNLRLEANKPTQLPVNSMFHFGASTRHYVLREKPQPLHSKSFADDNERSVVDEADHNLLGLPETEIELDNLTEFNTAHNRRISILGVSSTDDHDKLRKKRKTHEVTFQENEDIINPEDVDPSIGRFRNLIQTTVIPKSPFGSGNVGAGIAGKRSYRNISKNGQQLGNKYTRPAITGLYDDMENTHLSSAYNTAMSMNLPNSAPEITPIETYEGPKAIADDQNAMAVENNYEEDGNEDFDVPKKKKYAKEAWPGRKSNASQSLLV